MDLCMCINRGIKGYGDGERDIELQRWDAGREINKANSSEVLIWGIWLIYGILGIVLTRSLSVRNHFKRENKNKTKNNNKKFWGFALSSWAGQTESLLVPFWINKHHKQHPQASYKTVACVIVFLYVIIVIVLPKVLSYCHDQTWVCSKPLSVKV